MKNKTVSNKSSGGIFSAISELLQLIIIIPGAYLLKNEDESIQQVPH
ncbi:MAG: hypothetical protein R2759_18870 [Bacteroidales bacterium]